MSYCIVSNICGIDMPHYEESLERLEKNVKSLYGDSIITSFTKGQPKSKPLEITERENHEGFSYLSKFYALKDAIEQHNPEYVIWTDSTMFLQNVFLERSKSILDQNGVMLLSGYTGVTYGLEWWANDRFFDIIKEKRSSYKMPYITGGLYGIKISHPNGKLFWEQMTFYSDISNIWFGSSGFPWRPDDVGTDKISLDERVKGHRHDQCVMSHIVIQNNLPIYDEKQNPMLYTQSYIQEQYMKDPSKSSYHYPADAPVIHYPTRAHFEGTLSNK